MLPYLVWSLVFVLSCSSFQYSYLYGGVSRVFAGLRKAVVEAAVVKNKITILSEYSIDVTKLKKTSEEYFTLNLEPYCKRKDWNVICYADDTGPNGNIISNPDVYVVLNVDFGAFGTYKNSMSFRIKKGILYGK